MNAPDVFQYSGQQVRTVIVDGEAWFVATDVCRILEHSNPSMAVASLDDDEKGLRNVETPGGAQSLMAVNEPGLYSLILRSRKPEARQFKRWVTHEVLPQIRRTGEFRQTQIEHQAPQSYADALRELAEAVERREALEAKAAEDAPKVAAYDQLMDADGFYTMEAVAKIGGIGRTTLFRRLREAGVIQSGSRLPYQRYMHWFKITASSWTDAEGIVHPSNTARVLPSALTKVLTKAGVQIAQMELEAL